METLGAFLRARRGQLDPLSVGLPGGVRRRVPGLRREELALLAGISVEYYQRLEQGRATHPSADVVDALAKALGLDEVTSAHLHSLADAPRAGAADVPGPASPELVRLLNLMDKVPALVVNDWSDVLAVNALATRLFGGFAKPANLARSLFLDPAMREFYVDWAEIAAATAGQLRLAYGANPADRHLAALIAELTERSAEFRAYWGAAIVHQRAAGTKNVRHPAVGVLTLHFQNFAVIDAARQRLVVFTAEDGSPSEAALHLLATWAGTTDQVAAS